MRGLPGFLWLQVLLLQCIFFVPKSALGSEPDWWLKWLERSRAEEAKALLLAPKSVVSRRGRQLLLTMFGKPFELRDSFNPNDDFDFVIYGWRGLRLNGDYHEVHTYVHSNEFWIWYPRRGGEPVFFNGPPAISPSQQHVAAASADLVNIGEPGLVIWALTKTGLRQDFAAERGRYDAARWKDARTLIVNEWETGEAGCPQAAVRERELRHLGSTWRLSPARGSWRCLPEQEPSGER